MRTFRNIAISHAARIHAGAADADFAAVTSHVADHYLDVIETLRYPLITMSSRGRVTDHENTNLVAFLLGNGTCQSQTVVGALAAIGCIVEDEQGFDGNLLG